MNTFNPMMKAWANAERTQLDKAKGISSWRRRMKSSVAYLASTRRFRRTFSDEATGEEREMTGKDAKTLNDKLFQDYLVAMDANVEGRSLERWALVKEDLKL